MVDYSKMLVPYGEDTETSTGINYAKTLVPYDQAVSSDRPSIEVQTEEMVAARGLKLTRKIVLESETFKKYSPEEYRPGININDDEELVKEASNYAQTIFHPVGTCKMGQDDMAVVDEKLRVKGIKNLRVIDASIMPSITSGNTNAPTIMIAEKGADMILGH